MFKLLTEEEKIKVQAEYKARRLVVITALLAGALALGIATLYPSFIISSSREKDASLRLEAMNNLSDPTTPNLDQLIATLNTKIKIFSPAQDNDNPYEVFKEIINLKSGGIKLNYFSYQKAENTKQYVVKGVASDRRTLIDFQSKLNSSNEFSNANVPVSNLAKDKNIEFEMILTPKK